jgi:subtilisin family serine protease
MNLVGGTSAAAAIVTGGLALALSVNSDLSREQFEKLLHESSDRLSYPNGLI